MAATKAQTQWLTGHDGVINAAAVSPDGTRVASASEDGTVRVWDLKTRRAVRCVDCCGREDVGDVAWAGAEMLVIGHDKRVLLVDLAATNAIVIKAPTQIVELPSEVQCLAATEGLIAFGTEDGCVYAMREDVEGARKLSQVKPHENVVAAVAISKGAGAGAAQVWSVGMDCTMCITDFSKDDAEERKIELPGLQLAGPQVVNPPLPTSLDVCPTTNRGVVGILNGTAWVFSDEMEPVAVWQAEENIPIEAVCWHGEDRVWTAGRSGYVALWDLAADDEAEAEAGGSEGGAGAPPAASTDAKADTGADDAEEDEEDEESEEGASPPKVLTAVQCPDAITCLVRLPRSAAAGADAPPYRVLAGDVKGAIAMHALLSIDALRQGA